MSESTSVRLHAYAASRDLDRITPSMLGESRVDIGKVGPSGEEVVIEEAVSTKTTFDRQSIYTASCLDLPNHVASMLVSCYLLTPAEGRQALREALSDLHPEGALPHLKTDGTDAEKYDDWSLPTGAVSAYLSSLAVQSSVGEAPLSALGDDSISSIPALQFSSDVFSFRLVAVDGILVGQTVITGLMNISEPIYELSEEMFEIVRRKKRQE